MPNATARRQSLLTGMACLMAAWCPPLWAQLDDPYFAAVVRDDESAVVSYALRGGNLNAQRRGEHALLVAAREGSLKVAQFLVSQRNVQVDTPNAAGETALMLAAIKGHLPLVRALIGRGAAVNKPGWTPLHYAASHPEPVAKDIVALLLEHHAYIDAESPNGTTPLMMAARYGHGAAVELLLEEGADPAVRNSMGMAALDFAQSASRPDATQAILQRLRAVQPKGTW